MNETNSRPRMLIDPEKAQDYRGKRGTIGNGGWLILIKLRGGKKMKSAEVFSSIRNPSPAARVEVVKRLVTEGYIVKTLAGQGEDQRGYSLRITPKGRKALRHVLVEGEAV